MAVLVETALRLCVAQAAYTIGGKRGNHRACGIAVRRRWHTVDKRGTGFADPTVAGATLGRASAKAWRYVAEMEEIASTQGSAGLTPDLFEALADVYAGLAAVAVADTPEEVPDAMPLAEVLARFAGTPEVRDSD